MYTFDISHFANKWKRDCICLSIVDVFAGVTQFFHFGVYRVLSPTSSNTVMTFRLHLKTHFFIQPYPHYRFLCNFDVFYIVVVVVVVVQLGE